MQPTHMVINTWDGSPYWAANGRWFTEETAQAFAAERNAAVNPRESLKFEVFRLVPACEYAVYAALADEGTANGEPLPGTPV